MLKAVSLGLEMYSLFLQNTPNLTFEGFPLGKRGGRMGRGGGREGFSSSQALIVYAMNMKV